MILVYLPMVIFIFLANSKMATAALLRTVVALFFTTCIIGAFITSSVLAQTYSETFTWDVGYTPGSSQWDNWDTFRDALIGADSISISGSLQPTGRSCTNPALATQIANGLNTRTDFSIVCDGHTWRSATCGVGKELTVGSGSSCQCNSDYTIRPQIGSFNVNWGGIGSYTCNGPSQTMTLTVVPDSTAPTISLSAPQIHESNSFTVTYQFSENVTGFDISDIAVTNGSASNFIMVDGDTYTSDIIPSGGLDVTVAVSAGAAQDLTGNLLSNSAQAIVFYLPTTTGGSGSSTYSENFSAAVGYSPGSSQWDNWDSFRAALSGTFSAARINGTLDATGRSCTNPTLATQIANGLNAQTDFSIVCDGHTWRSSTCGVGKELTVGSGSSCQCSSDHTVRPQIGASNTNWGGIGGTTCNAPSQTITVEFFGDTVSPNVTITDVPAATDGSTPFVGTFTFSEVVTGLTLSEINAALTNATASTLTEIIPNRRFTVTITPNGAGNVSVGLNAGVVQDSAGNNNTAATPQVAILDSTPPSVSILNAPSFHDGSTAFNVTFEFSEDVINFDFSDITLGNATASNFVTVDSNTYTADINPSSGSDITIDVASAVAQDLAGNDNAAATQVMVGFPSASINKVVDVSNVTTLPAALTYTITVTNTGTANLASPTLTPTLAQSSNSLSLDASPIVSSGDTNANNILDVGETWIYTGIYTVTQANMDDFGDITCTMSFIATGIAAIATTAETTTISANPLLTVTKTADKTTDVVAGEDVTYTYVVTNAGNQTLTNISLSDAHGGTGTAPAPNADTATLTDNGQTGDSTNTTTGDNVWDQLAPGDILTATTVYTVTQEDIDTLQ